MIALPYIISFVTGLFILQRFIKEPAKLAGLLIPFAFSLGIGCSSLLTFYSLFIWNRFNPAGILFLHILFWAGLTVKTNLKPGAALNKTKNLCLLLFSLWPIWLAGAVAFHFLYTLSQHHPFGEWDAWAVWNVKTKFLTEGGVDWKNALRLHWHTQPDYPWFLPCLNAWAGAFASIPVHVTGQMTAVLLSTNTVLLLMAALQRHINYPFALLAAALLATNPVFTFLGTSQYADILLAHYLLMAVITVLILIRENDQDITVIVGLALGFLCFAKNEGIIITLIFLALLMKYFIHQKKMIVRILAVFCVAALAAILFKLFLAPVNRDISFTQLALLPSLCSFQRCSLIAQAFLKSMFDQQWNFIWLLLAALFAMDIRKYLHRESRAILLFMLIYAAVIFIIYLMTANFDLSWRLSRTVSRILFYMLPSVLFLGFYVHWHKR